MRILQTHRMEKSRRSARATVLLVACVIGVGVSCGSAEESTSASEANPPPLDGSTSSIADATTDMGRFPEPRAGTRSDTRADAARDAHDEAAREKPRCRRSPPRAGAPNIVLIAIDTLRADRISAYGYDRSATPHVARLAEDALVFEWAFSTAPWTNPAFAAMFTGESPAALGIEGRPVQLPADAPTLASLLCDAGYRTSAVISHTYLGREYGFAKGFEHWDQANALGHDHVSSVDVTDRALREIDRLRSGDRPFFLFVHYFDPHATFLRHEGYDYDPDYQGQLIRDGEDIGVIETLRTLSSKRRLSTRDYAFISSLYDSEVAFTDAHLGRLITHLEEMGLYDDALILFVADHGEMLGTREPSRWVGHTRHVLNALIRVPLLIKLPRQHGVQGRSGRVTTPVSTQDVASTILDVVHDDDGVDLPIPVSRSLLRTEEELARPVFSQTRRIGKMSSIVEGEWKLILYERTGHIALHHLTDDPDERTNVKDAHPDVAQRLRTRLERWIVDEGRRADARGPAATVELDDERKRELRELGYIDEIDE